MYHRLGFVLLCVPREYNARNYSVCNEFGCYGNAGENFDEKARGSCIVLSP